jgi:hypothetical protein
MNLQLPKLPGYQISHDPTKSNHKRISSTLFENNRYDDNKINKLTQSVVIPKESHETVKLNIRQDKSKSLSQSVHVNHFGPEISELFQPTWLKLDKKV